jgi:hypothetical protein
MAIKRIAVRLAPALLLASATPALAQGQWGALALSERSTAYGYSFDYDTQEKATERALAECAKNAADCRVHTTFRNTCLVVAGSVDGPIGWAWGGREQTRDQRALEQCRQRGAVNCKVVERICTGLARGTHNPRTPTQTQQNPPPAPPPPTRTAAPNTPPNAAPPPDTRAPGTPTQLHR